LVLGAGALGGLAAAGYLLKPAVETAISTVSTDDAFVNGHVTLVAPRVSGQVSRVLVDDNDRVKKGALLLQLDKERFEDQVEVKKAAVAAAESDLTAAQAQARGLIAQMQTDRFQLERAIEDVHTQVANLRSNIATFKSRQATLDLAQNNLRRGEELLPSGGISKEDLDQRRQSVKVAQAALDQALEAVLASRVGLGLPAQPPTGHELGEVPGDLDQNYSAIRQALGQLYRSACLLGFAPPSWVLSPKQALDIFERQDPERNLDRIFANLVAHAPSIKQADTKVHQARRDLVLAELDLRYCDVRSEIDGVVTSRNVNPGNNVQAGQSLLAVRSLTEIWIEANFKETQLAALRIGHRVRCAIDMYGKQHEFEGRISGFTMGTGQTLALLPPQNATGNFVKIVQRLPVRIELSNYDPDKVPLFVGLSVVPYVYYKERPTGPNAGAVLRPVATPPAGPTDTTSSPASGNNRN
jgi:membrane fusion protein (multidrug efflux system)